MTDAPLNSACPLPANRWGWLSDGQYAHVSAMVAEIGNLLGGWLKSAQKG